MQARAAVAIHQRNYDAVLFDLDGVLTDTARLHAVAWKAAFDDFLQQRASRDGSAFRPFDIPADYLTYVDGRPREDGIRTFLASRGISLPEGTERDPVDAETIQALGRRKMSLFLQELLHGVDPAPGAEKLLKALRQAGIKIVVATSSKNGAAILKAAALDRLIDLRIDGIDAAQLGLPGKPDPALFLEAARRVEAEPSRAILFEDAIAGVEAGRHGGFRCVVGVDRYGQAEALRQHGADVVVGSLQEVEVTKGG